MLVVLVALATGAWFWSRLQPRFATDLRRDLFTDAARVTLLEGFDGRTRLEPWVDVSREAALDPVNPDRDELALLVPRAGRLRWDLGSTRPGRLSLGVARLASGPAADASACELVVRAGGVEVVLPLAAAPAAPGLPAGHLREGPALPLHLALPQGAAALEFELRAPDGAGGYAVLLSPRVEQAPLPVPVREARASVPDELRLLPLVQAGGGEVAFARVRRAPGIDPLAEPDRARAALQAAEPVELRVPAVEPTGAFPGAAGEARPSLALTGAARLELELDLPPGARLRARRALDARLPAGAAAELVLAVDGVEAGRVRVDSAAWRELDLDLAAHAGARRRLALALEAPQLPAGGSETIEPDYDARALVAAQYEPLAVRVGLADPRLSVAREVPRRVASRERPSLLLIQVETLRADVLAPFLREGEAGFGAPADLAPNLARLAQRATRWRRAMTPSPWTLPTAASLLTGLPPSAHGATTHARMALPGDVPTLAELCAAAGLATGAVVTSDLLGEPAGFARGFQSFAHVPYANARQAHDLAAAFLANHVGQQFLLFVHAFDPHSPYAAPEPWRERWVDPALRGRTVAQAEARVLAAMQAHVEQGAPAPGPDDPDLAFLRQRYLGEVAWWDSRLGALLDELERLGLDDSTLVAITADHGEEFFEHGLFGHGSNLHDETLHVPLLVAPPPGWRVALPAGAVLEEPVGTEALFASALEWLGVPFDSGRVSPPLARPRGFAFSETDKGLVPGPGDPFRRRLDSVRTEALRATVSWPVAGEEGGPRHAAWDLRADPGARVPLAPGAEAAAAFQLLGRAVEWCEQHRATAAPEGLGAGQLEALQRLGYTGATTPPR